MTEKKLKEAIQKKKQELIKKKKIRKTTSKKDLNISLRNHGAYNKVEKELRRMKAENINLKEKNNHLKKRLSAMVASKDLTKGIYQTVKVGQKLDNS